MQSWQLKLAALSQLISWITLVLITVTGHLLWDNRLLWVPLGLFVTSLALASFSWEFEERHALVLVVMCSAIASIVLYAVFYVFLFLYSIPNHGG